MDRSHGNIDLAFRNGLKDYEVLPPEEVWKKVRPAISVKKVPVYFRSAALIAAFISISVVAFLIGRSSSKIINDSYVAFNISQPDPYFGIQNSGPVNIAPSPFRIREISPQNPEQSAPSADIIKAEEIVFQTGNQRFLVQPLDKAVNAINMPDLSQPVRSDGLSKNKPVINRRLSLEVMAAPTHYSMMGGGNSFSRQLLASEKPLSSFSGGFTVSYRINRRVSIQTGMFYSSQGQKVTGVYSYAGFRPYSESKGGPNFELKTASGPVQTANEDVFISVSGNQDRIKTQYTNDVFDPEKANLSYLGNELSQNFSYLQLPVMMRYKIIDRNLDVNLTGGVSYDFLIKNDAYTDVDGIKYFVGETRGINTLALSSSFGMGFEYGLTDRISLNLEPTFRYYLNPFNEPTEQKIHPYSFGVFSGFSFRF